mmetsp:Transcript_140833/g.342168  ORF Transcript_140833/g.342168 Transcript_140833/m.342168 type:complete len:363 (+) Transcript_140833:283-1371(+)
MLCSVGGFGAAGEAEDAAEHVGARLLRGALAEHARAHDLFLQVQLLATSSLHVTFDPGLRDQPKDAHLVLLADAVRTSHSLLVILRVPVQVEKDDRVRCLQVQAQAASPGREQEDHGAALLLRIEGLDPGSPLLVGCLPVQAHEFVASPVQVGAKNIQDAGELGEDEGLVPKAQELRKHAVQNFDLARRPVKVFPWLVCAHEEVGMQDHLAQLHKGVVHLLRLDLVLGAEEPDRLPLEVRVGPPLPGAEPHAHRGLDLGRQPVLHDLRLRALQQEGREHRVEPRDDLCLVCCLQLNLVLIGEASHALEGFQKPLLEVQRSGEELRQQVMQQRPELVHVVLQWGPCQQHARSATHLRHCLMQH